MNKLAIAPDRGIDLSSMSTEELRTELADAIGMTAATLSRLAMIWKELEYRGEDLSALRGGGLFTYLPLIAQGNLLPEVVVRCAGQAMMIRTLSQMPISTQRKILEDGFSVVEISDEGDVATKIVHVEKMTSHMLRRAVIGDQLRTVTQQVAMLAPKTRTPAKKRGVTIHVRLTADEYDKLKNAAIAKNVTTPTFARELLMSGFRDVE